MLRRLLMFAFVVGLVACGSNDNKLKVTGLEPEKGDVEGGTYVKVFGANFINPTRSAKVYFGNRQGTVVRFASDSELIVEAPGGKPNEQDDVLIIFEPGGELKIPGGFTFVEKNNEGPSVDQLDTSKVGK